MDSADGMVLFVLSDDAAKTLSRDLGGFPIIDPSFALPIAKDF